MKVKQHLRHVLMEKVAYLDSTGTIEASLQAKEEQLAHRKELLAEQEASVKVKLEQEENTLDDAERNLKDAKATKKHV